MLFENTNVVFCPRSLIGTTRLARLVFGSLTGKGSQRCRSQHIIVLRQHLAP